MVAPWNAARSAANDIVSQQEAVGGKHMLDVLTRREKMLEQIDRSFKIEMAFLSSLADAGGALCANKRTSNTFLGCVFVCTNQMRSWDSWPIFPQVSKMQCSFRALLFVFPHPHPHPLPIDLTLVACLPE
jgi:hypothetical protein